jgi:hypothetical protein
VWDDQLRPVHLQAAADGAHQQDGGARKKEDRQTLAHGPRLPPAP